MQKQLFREKVRLEKSTNLVNLNIHIRKVLRIAVF